MNWEPTEEGKKLVYRHLGNGNTFLAGNISITRTSKNMFDVEMTSQGVLIKKATMKLRVKDTLAITDMQITISGTID